MPRKSRTLLFSAVLVLLVAGAASAFLIIHASTKSPPPITQSPGQRRPTSVLRNLSLRPEALGVARRLGNRFNPSSRAVSVAVGSLTIAGSQQRVTFIRRQTENGEAVELLLGGHGLTWSDREGIRAPSGLLTDAERSPAERLIFDSPDQFVLAQLRGASYFTVARNVRPADAGDDYTGALWNLVRVTEPQENENSASLSSWRIYYINSQTGLPDRVQYQLNGQEIKAEFLEWTEQNAEKTPSYIRWSANDQTIMEYWTTNVSHKQ
jgi:hypothetical protein